MKLLISLLVVLTVALLGLMHLAAADNTSAMATAWMATGLVAIWVLVGGGLMLAYRERIRARVLAIPIDWRVKFVVLATLLACIEEAVTVSMTNLAPLFGAAVGEAYITASANYLDVIFFHSVVVFVPYFIALAFLLSKYDFSPFTIFISFGVVGTVSEAIFAGNAETLLTFPLWCLVYGLMVYLPAYSIPHGRGARRPTKLNVLLLAPATFVLALPLIALIAFFIEGVLGHPSIHFP